MMRRLRVLQVGPLPPLVGGMATVVANLMQHQGSCDDARVLDNAKTTPADRPLWQGVVAQLRLLGRLGSICALWRPQVVHVHTCSQFTFWRSAVDVALARLLGRRVVLQVHSNRLDEFIAQQDRPRRWLAMRALALADRVLILGEFARATLGTWVEPARVEVVPNAVTLGPSVEYRAEGALEVLCLANYEARKAQSDLVLALARLPLTVDVRLRFAGVESVPGARACLLALADGLGLRGRVSADGPLLGTDKADWLRRGDCMCLPSRADAMPMSILEAMAIGLPVVATRVGAIPEMLADGTEGLLCAPGDIDALAGHLHALATDSALRRRLGQAGRERIRREFEIRQCVQRLHELYLSLT